MEDYSEFSNICPYNDEEASAALARVAGHPTVPAISKRIFPDKPDTFLRDILLNIHGVDEFQGLVMSRAIDWVIQTSAHNFSYDGLRHITALEEAGKKYLCMSNHRDIILDPAITQLILFKNNLPETEIAVGDNLLTNSFIEDLIRSNRMIKVIRGISAKELYLSSQLLSKYIRRCITTGKNAIWLAQRQGRTKDGIDTTEQGLLKMLDMSGSGDFTADFMELNILPLSISYEYEPCGILKAREKLITRTNGKYVKASGEDLRSIVSGIVTPKGNIHLNIGSPLTEEEIHRASLCDRNDRYQWIRHAVDFRIIFGYKLWKTNFMAYDIVEGTTKYSDRYQKEDLEAFREYVEKELAKVEPELDRDALRDIFLHIYSNPVVSREKLMEGVHPE